MKLAIDTLGRDYAVALADADGTVLAELRSDVPGDRDLAGLVDRVLGAADASREALTSVSCTAGPGVVGCVRDGVAFAGALAYALEVPLHCPNAFTVAGSFAAAAHGRPCVFVAKGREGRVYLATATRERYDARLVERAVAVERLSAVDLPAVLVGDVAAELLAETGRSLEGSLHQPRTEPAWLFDIDDLAAFRVDPVAAPLQLVEENWPGFAHED